MSTSFLNSYEENGLFEAIPSSAASLHNGCSIKKFDMTRYFQVTSTLRSQTEHAVYENDAEQHIYHFDLQIHHPREVSQIEIT